jgi:peptidoglycan hydrolase-like protein with peptidoglycan-binding domain
VTYPCITLTARDELSGGAVSAVQEALRAKGMSPIGVTGDTQGVFGDNTLAMVNKFQSSQGLAPDGIVGPNTGRLLGLSFAACSAPYAVPQSPMAGGAPALAAMAAASGVGDGQIKTPGKVAQFHADYPWAFPLLGTVALLGTFGAMYAYADSQGK